MTAIVLKTFDGMYPVVNERLLGDAAAQVAANTKITGGSLKPWRTPTIVGALRSSGTVHTLYLFNKTRWFEWPVDVDVVRGPIAGDTLERTYYTGDGAPKVTAIPLDTSPTSATPGASYVLGVPPPVEAPLLELVGTPTGDGKSDTRFYVYTYVTAWGEEGPPSPTAEVIVPTGQTVALSNIASGPGGAYNLTTKRIYRTSTGSTASDFQFVGEIPLGIQEYDDTKTGLELGEVMPSSTWYPPRSDVHNEPGVYNTLVTSPSPYTLKGLTMMANGIMAGFAGNILCFSEPFMPHAWPRQYELTTDQPIVGLGAFGQTLAVLTESYPYLVTGTAPESMTMRRLEIAQSCVSKRSIVEMGDGVIYASPDGLVSISVQGVQLITTQLFTRDEWQEFKPESLFAVHHDSRYFAFYDTGTERGCLVFSFNGVEPSLVRLNLTPSAVFTDPLSDSLYLALNGSVQKFDSGTPMTYTWTSKRFTLPSLQNLALAQVIAKTYPVTLTVSGQDSAYVYSQTITSSDPVRMPATARYRSVELTLNGTGEVEQVLLASSMMELRAQ